MSKTPVPFAPETLETIQRAFRMASDRRHEEVGLEHLLLAITDEPQGRRVLTSCGANLDVLRRQLTDVLTKAFTPVALLASAKAAITAVSPSSARGAPKLSLKSVLLAFRYACWLQVVPVRVKT